MQDFLKVVFSTYVTSAAFVIGFFGLILVTIYMAGKIPVFNTKFNTQTKRAKKYLNIGYASLVLSVILFVIGAKHMSYGDDNGKTIELKNPYLGDWVVTSTEGYELYKASRITYTASEGRLWGTIKTGYANPIGSLHRVIVNHYDYLDMKGVVKLNEDKNNTLYFESTLDVRNKIIHLEYYKDKNMTGGVLGKLTLESDGRLLDE